MKAGASILGLGVVAVVAFAAWKVIAQPSGLAAVVKEAAGPDGKGNVQIGSTVTVEDGTDEAVRAILEARQQVGSVGEQYIETPDKTMVVHDDGSVSVQTPTLTYQTLTAQESERVAELRKLLVNGGLYEVTGNGAINRMYPVVESATWKKGWEDPRLRAWETMWDKLGKFVTGNS